MVAVQCICLPLVPHLYYSCTNLSISSHFGFFLFKQSKGQNQTHNHFYLFFSDFPKHVIYGLMIMAAGCSVIGLALATNTTGMVISMLVYGLGSGAWFLMVPLLLSEYLGVERIGSSYGLIRLFQALSNLVGPVIGGVLSDQTGSFAASFVVMGLIMNLGAIAVFLKPIIERKKKTDDSQMSDKQGCAE